MAEVSYPLTFQNRSDFRYILRMAWALFGCIGLIWLALFEPFSARLLAHLSWNAKVQYFVVVPTIFLARAVLLVEAVGYFYHRFFQHLGILTRTGSTIQRNQRHHWIHHMVYYPIGKIYKRDGKYRVAEEGIPWSWVAPVLVVMGAIFLTLGFGYASFLFIGFIIAYAKMISVTHKFFHLKGHALEHVRYFNWLEDIHLLHHWDQEYNFTIVNPFMDMLFGSYLSPRTHRRELEVASRFHNLLESDFINWRYLVNESGNASVASYVSAAAEFPNSLRKMPQLITFLRKRIEVYPGDVEAKQFHDQIVHFLQNLNTPRSVEILASI